MGFEEFLYSEGFYAAVWEDDEVVGSEVRVLNFEKSVSSLYENVPLCLDQDDLYVQLKWTYSVINDRDISVISLSLRAETQFEELIDISFKSLEEEYIRENIDELVNRMIFAWSNIHMGLHSAKPIWTPGENLKNKSIDK